LEDISVYRFEACPFKDASSHGETMCFDTEYKEFMKRTEETIHQFCENNFRLCPYYQIQGMKNQVETPRRMFGKVVS
jgi:hypothetical protein